MESFKNRVTLKPNAVINTSTMEYPNTTEDDNVFDLEKFKKRTKFSVIKKTEEVLEFDLIGVDTSLANAIRRVMIAEVPTMAIETVYVMNNTSIISDQILAQRLGLIPLKADPRKFEFKEAEEEATDLNTIVFKLNIKCEKNPAAPKDVVDPKVIYKNAYVLSKELIWVPQGDQPDIFTEETVGPVHDDIMIAKLRPGQEIDLQMFCEKGIGKTHAKWSPVSNASYRLMPEIILKRRFEGEEALKLQSCFSKGVIEIEEKNGKKIAKIGNPRNESMSREVFRHEEFVNDVVLQRVRDHFIFSIETIGSYEPVDILKESLKILISKTQALKIALAAVLEPESEGSENGTENDEMEVAEENLKADEDEDEEDVGEEDEDEEDHEDNGAGSDSD